VSEDPSPPRRTPLVVRTRTAARGDRVHIGPLLAADHRVLFRLFARVVSDREGYPHAPPLTLEAFRATWVVGVTVAIAARIATTSGHELVGAYYLRPNFVGRAAHIANAGYVVGAPWRRRGIGRLLVEDSVLRARCAGFDAVQFNLVFVSNPARALYEQMGWRPMGRVPAAVEGEDALIYHRRVR
jgi:GNAT superfamily N-acetyltransferase